MAYYAVFEKYIQNLDEVYDLDAKPIFSEPILAFTCECIDQDEVIAFNRFLYGEDCDPCLDIEIEQVSVKAPLHYDRDSVKAQLMKTFAVLADIEGIDRVRMYGKTDLVAAALSDD